MKINEGEVPQYYIENSHKAIIDPMEWEAVQDEFKRRKSIGRAYSGKSVFSAKSFAVTAVAFTVLKPGIQRINTKR